MRAFAFLLLAAAGAAELPSPPPVASLAWLPASTQSIMGARGDGAPLLKWMRSTFSHYLTELGPNLPDCWSRVTAPIVASYQIWAGWEDQETAVLVQGRIDRTLLESCLDTTLRDLRSAPRMARTGPITQVDADVLGTFGTRYIGWTPSWVVIHPTRVRVEELLAASRKGSLISPALAAAIARADRSALWMATTRDYSSLFFGVPSRSMMVSLPSAAGATIYVTYEFASAAESERATRAIDAASGDAALAPEIRRVAQGARYHARDRFVVLELDGKVLTDNATMAAMQAWLEKRRSELGQR